MRRKRYLNPNKLRLWKLFVSTDLLNEQPSRCQAYFVSCATNGMHEPGNCSIVIARDAPRKTNDAMNGLISSEITPQEKTWCNLVSNSYWSVVWPEKETITWCNLVSNSYWSVVLPEKETDRIWLPNAQQKKESGDETTGNYYSTSSASSALRLPRSSTNC